MEWSVDTVFRPFKQRTVPLLPLWFSSKKWPNRPGWYQQSSSWCGPSCSWVLLAANSAGVYGRLKTFEDQKSDFGWFVQNTCISHWSNWGSQPYIARLVHTVRSHLVTGMHIQARPKEGVGLVLGGTLPLYLHSQISHDFSWFLYL